jgi:lipoprotein-anchoring transpeptidase ErfK/SrfK
VTPRRAIALAALGLAIPSASPAAGAVQPTAKPLHDVKLYAAPAGRVVGRVAAGRPLTGSPTVLPVIERARRAGHDWLRVRLPQRPNGASGWIAADGTVAGTAPWRVVVDRSRRRAAVYRGGRLVRRFRVVVGRRFTPTPLGRFFVAERVRLPRGSALGPWVLATSAYSRVLQEFDGGPGQIGLHGRTGLPGPLGSASSHGCVRFADRAIAWLARRARPGTPVRIHR